MNRRFLLIALLLVLLGGKAASQVRDITFTVSPVVEHTWWNDDLSLENSSWMGLKAGFGFGPLFELRGFYQRAGNVKNRLLMPAEGVITEPLHITGESDLTRYGGEMKVNLAQGGFLAPYITLGGGVQQMEHLLLLAEGESDALTLQEEQLFGALGLGTRLQLSDRVVLSLEAKNSFFGMNGASPLLSPSYNGEEGDRLHNWSAAASLDFYLGGSNHDEGSVAEAYRRLLADGFHGMKFVLEPGGTYINFHDESPLQNHYLLGASAGVDFTSLVGMRGFYYRSTDEADKLSLSMGDQLTIYGANLIARLNQPRGVNPYLQLGAGHIKVTEEYVARDGFGTPESRNFAFGGAGLEIPLSRYMALFGSASAMLTSESGVEATEMINPSQVKTSMLYNAGVRFNLGRPAENGADALFSSQLDDAMTEERAARNSEINTLRADYESRLASLESQRALAEAQGDSIRARALLVEQSRTVVEKDRMEQALRVLDNEGQVPRDRMAGNLTLDEELLDDELRMQRDGKRGDRVLRMSSEDLAQLVDRVVEEVRRDTRYVPYYGLQPSADGRQQVQPTQETTRQEELRSAEMARLERQNSELTRRLDELTIRLDEASRRGTASSETIVITDRGSSTSTPVVSPMTGYTGGNGAARDNRTFKWNRLSFYTGPGFGDLSAWHLGVRGHMQISNTSLDFMPEFYAAMGSKSGVGISGNVIWNMERFSTRFTPYLGLGLGIFHGEKIHTGTNIIMGSTLNLGSGAIFADYSIRSFFKQNQLALGYRFVF
jgi:hypothetical protein